MLHTTYQMSNVFKCHIASKRCWEKLSLAPTWLPLPFGTPELRDATVLPGLAQIWATRADASGTQHEQQGASKELRAFCCKTCRKCGSQLQEKQQKLTSTTRVSFSALLEKCRDLDLKPKHSEWSVDRIQRSYLGISLKRLNVDVLCRLQT